MSTAPPLILVRKAIRDSAAWLLAAVLIAAAAGFAVRLAVAEAASSTPAFVQKVSGYVNGSSLVLTPAANVTTGNRLVVQAVVWSAGGATASGVTDSAGNQYVELLHYKTTDGTEMSVWTAPVTAGGGTRPTITVKSSATASLGAVALEYSGLSTVGDASVVDQMSHASGATGGSGATVASGATAATTAGNELAIGFYGDSGFGDTVTADATYSQRVNTSPTTSAMEHLVEDQVIGAGATPNATASTGVNTPWLMATIVFKSGPSGPPTAPSPPTGVSATAGNASATVSWTAPSSGGSPITSYTVTPYIGSTAQGSGTAVPAPATSVTIGSLTNGQTYTFQVSATNAIGTSLNSSPSNAVTPSTSPTGQWSAVMNWPIVAVHSVLLKNGKFLLWDGWEQPEPTQIWDPSSQTFSNAINAPDSIFCSGTAELPDGRVIVIGGYGASIGLQGIVDTSLFDPATSTWSRVADMHFPRWYPTLTELADGRFVALSGQSTSNTTWADTPEVYDPSANTWTNINVLTSQVHEQEYPFSYLVPNGDIFTIAPSVDKSFFLDVAHQTWTQVGGASGVFNGSSVMYRPGKILYSGGATNTVSADVPAQATTAVIDLSASTPTWRQTSAMNTARVYHTLTMLADGTVLAAGGTPTSTSGVTGGVLPSEIWNPATETWTTVASMAVTRAYHSTAVLMPDARVLVAGGGHDENNTTSPGQFNAQIYSPPYLFAGPRPTIASAPATASYGSSFSVSTPDAASIKAVNLVSLGADTHQIDMDQHFVPLNFTSGAGALNVTAPTSGSIAPPGNYMLFIVNAQGVPSVASFIHVAPAPTAPAPPTGVSATPGNGRATVSWTAPSDGGSPITSYTVTPYLGSTALTPTTVTGSPPPTATTIGSLTNGQTYTFQVSATNAIGTSLNSSPSNAVTPSATPTPGFVQKVSGYVNGSSLGLTPAGNVAAVDRLVVQAVVWSAGGATASGVTDSAGNQYVELLHYKTTDGTEMSVWTAPVTAGGGTRPTITIKSSATASLGAVALDYSGLSTVGDASVVDQMSHASGSTGGSGATVASGATAATTAGNELAIGFYGDSGFGDTVTADANYTQRVNTAPTTSAMEHLVEDRVLGAGATANATASTGANTPWLMATIIFKSG